jgi:putative ATPase
MPEGYLPMTECALYLALAPKSNSAITSYGNVLKDVAESLNQPVPLHLRNAVTSLNRSLGYGKGYRYAHDFDQHYADQQHLPDELAAKVYYQPGTEGIEPLLKERLDRRKRSQS